MNAWLKDWRTGAAVGLVTLVGTCSECRVDAHRDAAEAAEDSVAVLLERGRALERRNALLTAEVVRREMRTRQDSARVRAQRRAAEREIERAQQAYRSLGDSIRQRVDSTARAMLDRQDDEKERIVAQKDSVIAAQDTLISGQRAQIRSYVELIGSLRSELEVQKQATEAAILRGDEFERALDASRGWFSWDVKGGMKWFAAGVVTGLAVASQAPGP